MNKKAIAISATIAICLCIAAAQAKPPGGKGGGGGSKVPDPSNLQVADVSETSIDLTWNPPRKGADSYEVRYQTESYPPTDGTSGELVTSNDTSATLSGLNPGANYFIRVSSVVNGKSSEGITTMARTLADPTALSNFWEYPHKIAISDNGNKMVVWVTFVNDERHLYYSRFDGVAWSAAIRLSSIGRSLDAGFWNNNWGIIDVAAGDGGNFVVGWIDESAAGDTPRVNLTRFINGLGWDNGGTPTTYELSGPNLNSYHGINVDMSPTGDASAAVNDHVSLSESALWVFYAPLAGTWSQIANDGDLTDAAGGEEDFVRGAVPALDMDEVGNVMVAFASDSAHFVGNNQGSGSGIDIFYAVYDRANAGWADGGRQLVSDGWIDIYAIRVSVDKTTDLTDASATNNRGLAGLVWAQYRDELCCSGDIYGAMYYKGGSGGDVDDDFQSYIGNGNPNLLDGLDIADGDGHLLVTYTDEVQLNQKLVHFWFEDADNDGLFDSVDEPTEQDGSGNAGWKWEVTVNDDTILNSPYFDGDVQFAGGLGFPDRNNSRLSVGGGVGLIVWSTLMEDAVHVRRILGFDAITQSVILEGNAFNEIASVANHTLDSSSTWEYADWLASPVVHYLTGEGAALFHSETTFELEIADF